MPSDQVIMAIASGVFSLLGTIFAGVMTYMMAKLNRKVENVDTKIDKNVIDQKEERKEIKEEVVAQAAKVKEDLIADKLATNQKLHKIANAAQVTQVILSSNMIETQLRESAETARRLAQESPDNSDCAEAAAKAEAKLEEHKRKQAELAAEIVLKEGNKEPKGG